jgi:regulator of sigma E protease
VFTVIVTLFVLGVLIFVHELGHFLAAKAVGIGVPRFSIGFGPATPLRFRRGETEYVVAWFPLGGYVKMASREEQEAMSSVEGGALEDAYPPEKLFESKPLGARIVVISAGVLMNVLFAWVVYTGLAGLRGRTEDPTTTLGPVVVEQLPAEAAALGDVQPGTRVVRLNGDTVASWQEMMRRVLDPTEDALVFEFADRAPIRLPVEGTDVESRTRIARALAPAWPPRAGAITPGLPADEAGLVAGDEIVSVEGRSVGYWHDIPSLVEPRAGDSLRFEVRRADSLFAVTMVPVERAVPDPWGDELRRVGQIGFGVPDIEPIHVRFGPLGAPVEGLRRVWGDVELVWVTVSGIVTRKVSAEEVGGPILIGQLSARAARLGIAPLLMLMALISVNLAILNLLPIPALDGGHLLFLLWEGVRGEPLSLEARLRLTQVGILLLLALMVLVFRNDLLRVFGG